jgi:2-O-(6-phospho-alpha-D-mannosyl)-D-glycerate hydrolase
VVATPGAQCLEAIEAHLALFVDGDARAVRDAELGLRAVPAGDAPLFQSERALLTIEPREILLTAMKPAEDREGIIVRLLNPTDAPVEARLQAGFPLARVEGVRLDEQPAAMPIAVEGESISLTVPPHALRSLRVTPGVG